MKKTMNRKTILLRAGLTAGLSLLFTANVYAYTPGITAYTAVGGDSLYKISQIFHTTVGSLMNANHLSGYTVNIGQKLEVPGDTYTVLKGDTMFLIAKKYKMPLSDLQRANNIYGDNLDIGRQLSVPVGCAATSVPLKSNPAPTPPAAPAVNPAPAAVPASNQSAAISGTDLDLLSRLICAEAQGESYQAKVAIGAVVINRVQSGLFADSIQNVINQKINGYYQFTPVANGWINNPADSDSVRAAKEAMSGSDPTNGALWYYDDSTTNSFMLSKKVAVKLDHMVFAY